MAAGVFYALVIPFSLFVTESGASVGPRVVLVGDSTVTDRVGWAAGFRQFLTDGVDCINVARGGRSSKSYRAEGRWGPALALKGDYYLIQFGHNDVPGKGAARETDPTTTFAENMTRYVEEVRAAGAQPVLITPLAIRVFDPTASRLISKLAAYAEAVRTVAARTGVPLVDLDANSRTLCERLGPAETAKFDPHRHGQPDPTHLNAHGSVAFARLLVEGLREKVPALRPYLRDEAQLISESELVTDVRYAGEDNNALMLDISVPDGGGPFPVAVLLNGHTAEQLEDPERMGDAMDVAPWWRALQTRQFTRVLVNYRPAYAELDITTALRWVREQAGKYKGDPKRVMLCGHGDAAAQLLHATMKRQTSGVLAVVGTSPDWAFISETVCDVEDQRVLKRDRPYPKVLVVQGARRGEGPRSATETFLASWRSRGGRGELMTVNSAGDSLLDWERNDRRYASSFLAWLQEAATAPTQEF